ncbi:MAG: phenylalanine--tRNA ligase subunit beta [Holosporaceae bacterium]|jgi:phenylalanyl-tRNA synthetase beta chain|nr:phenylalanine--tRNA ligase subunit beta [Holosporaceae bacterium]
MRFSFNWLKRHLSTDLNIRQIADRLTSIGLEVENLLDPGEIFRNFKLVQIEAMEKHPDADRLNICIVMDARGQKMRIVCGAKNAKVGLKTILAMPGAIIPSSREILKKSKIRGIESDGMMCSPAELSISSDKDGIVELKNEIDLETSVGDVLGYGGGIIDLSITPNRGDCLSVKGIARDLAVAGVGDFISSEAKPCKDSFKFPLDIECERSDSCSQYAPIIAFRVIRNLKNGSSPEWIKSFLQSASMNSVSAVVDMANWWMMDSGRPLHIYDLKKIKGRLAIRFAKHRERFTDLKNVEHNLHRDMLVAADAESPLCLLGIMGGAKVACDENTTDILIESAFFDPIFVSRTGTLLNLSSDSRTMFERGIDETSCVSGIEGASKLILDNCGGEASKIFVVGREPMPKQSITLRKEKLLSICGHDVDWESSRTILKKLGLREIESSKTEATYAVPRWRSDISIEEDLIEEILRITGYDNIPEKKMEDVFIEHDKILSEKKCLTEASRLLASCGLSEVISYSFIREDYANAFQENNKLIHLINPISADLNVMRPSLIPNLLLAAKRSLNYGQSGVKIFEIGNVFYNQYVQERHITGLRTGSAHDRSWLQKKRSVDPFDAKADAFALLDYLGIKLKNVVVETVAPSYYHPSRSGTLFLRKKKLGYFGELHPKINKLFGIAENLVCFELLVASLQDCNGEKNYYVSKVFPKIVRDFAFVFGAKVAIGNIMNAIYKLDPLISKVDIFDYFNLSDTQNSIGVSVTLEAVDRTLTEDEAKKVSAKILEYIGTVGGELRAK